MDSLAIIVDIVVILLVVLITVVAIKKGFLRTIFGLVSSILVIVIAVFAAAPLANAIGKGTQWDEKLESTLQGRLSGKIPNYYGEILYYDLDGDGEVELAFKPENTDEYKPYDQVFTGSSLRFIRAEKIMRKTAENNINKEDSDSSITVINALAKTLTSYIFLAACFIAIAIIAKILFMILTKLLIKAASNLYFVHFVDKLLGGVFGFLLGALIVLIILAILQTMINGLAFMSPVKNFLEKSYIVKFIMDRNFLYNFFANNFSVDKLKGLFGGKK